MSHYSVIEVQTNVHLAEYDVDTDTEACSRAEQNFQNHTSNDPLYLHNDDTNKFVEFL